jgi:uncharacterized membrane protein YsdA (DUF1294 family)/cold shock CspA family protein
MRHHGRLVAWKGDKGYGFIESDAGGPQIFVHIKAFMGRRRAPVVGDRLSFDIATDLQNKLRAGNVLFDGERQPRGRRTAARPQAPGGSAAGVWIAVGVALACFAVLVWNAVRGTTSVVVPGIYFLATVVAFVSYALDKSAAMNRRWRTEEGVLHFVALIGGWPGALIAQQLFRHKTRKLSFLVGFWLMVGLNLLAYGWLTSPAGQHWAASLGIPAFSPH